MRRTEAVDRSLQLVTGDGYEGTIMASALASAVSLAPVDPVAVLNYGVIGLGFLLALLCSTVPEEAEI
jgi:hypothetical protein